MVLYNDFWYKKYIVVKIILAVCNIFCKTLVSIWYICVYILNRIHG